MLDGPGEWQSFSYAVVKMHHPVLEPVFVNEIEGPPDTLGK